MYPENASHNIFALQTCRPSVPFLGRSKINYKLRLEFSKNACYKFIKPSYLPTASCQLVASCCRCCGVLPNALKLIHASELESIKCLRAPCGISHRGHSDTSGTPKEDLDRTSLRHVWCGEIRGSHSPIPQTRSRGQTVANSLPHLQSKLR